MQQNWIQRFPLNTKGRSFAISDIHGCYKLLKKRLEAVGFDKSVDLAFPVGDLVDRGPHNEMVLDYLDEDWWKPIIGNHEAFILKLYRNGNPSAAELKNALDYKGSGFDWWAKTSPEFRRAFIDKVSKLPIATELETKIGRVGMIHADVPSGMHWDNIVDLINHPDFEQRRLLLSNRDRVKNKDCTPVPGVERVYVGHNIVRRPLVLGNLVAIDTGAYKGKTRKWRGKGQLSVVRVDVSMAELNKHIEKLHPGQGLLIP
jgi:serine/threonine protein phosphatase 1